MSKNEGQQRGYCAVYVCVQCGSIRQFGMANTVKDAVPDGCHVEVPLNCCKCHKVTFHRYCDTAALVQVKLPYGETKWVIESQVLEGKAKCATQAR